MNGNAWTAGPTSVSGPRAPSGARNAPRNTSSNTSGNTGQDRKYRRGTGSTGRTRRYGQDRASYQKEYYQEQTKSTVRKVKAEIRKLKVQQDREKEQEESAGSGESDGSSPGPGQGARRGVTARRSSPLLRPGTDQDAVSSRAGPDRMNHRAATAADEDDTAAPISPHA